MLARRYSSTHRRWCSWVREDLLEIQRSGVDDVAVPEPVIEEIRGHGMGDPTVLALDRPNWLTIVPGPVIPPAIAAWRLGPGESAVLALALAEAGSWAVLDDGRRVGRPLALDPGHRHAGPDPARQGGGVGPGGASGIERLRRSGMYLSDEATASGARVGE